MDETYLKSISDRDYISLEDQRNAVEKLPSPRRPVLQEGTTRIHFAVHHGGHWTAVQLSISPFEIRAFPKQKFFRCSFRYIPCCEADRSADISPDVISAVQRIYDCYYQPTQWDFSSEYYRTSDPPPHNIRYPNQNTCAENACTALIEYIHQGKDIAETERSVEESELRDAVDRNTQEIERQTSNTLHEIDHSDSDRQPNRIKHPRLNILHDINHDDRYPQNPKRQRLHIDDDHNRNNANDANNNADNVHNVHDNHNDDDNRGSDMTTEGEEAATEGGSEAAEGDNRLVEFNAEAVLRIIQKGLSIVLQSAREGKSSQVQARHTQTVVTKNQHSSTDIIPSHFFAQNTDTSGSRSLQLEELLWQQSKTVLRSAKKIAWKSSFLAACLRRSRDPTISGKHKSTYRWTTAAWMINSIVDGLWSTWGPKAALIYEALAVKNYNLSRIVHFSRSTRSKIITHITKSLRDSVPDTAFEIDVFHPAALISTALGIEYKTICASLGLASSFGTVGSLQYLQSHTSLSSLCSQWNIYLATLPANVARDSAESEFAVPNSPLIALTVVAVAALDRHSGCTAGCRHCETGSRLRLAYNSTPVGGAGPAPGGPLENGPIEWEEVKLNWEYVGPLGVREWEEVKLNWEYVGPLGVREWEALNVGEQELKHS